ncbi:protein FAR1-RELATED SEQUENCE 5-like [Elaeis guineensis]|uniref:protein FAR1-RELATED sequence 5 isoform X1 n=1 Tax=Elaeis guineensis var. tenera TaxID=51953 RepID=A0A6I9QX29_ELAGV|nr:protein FAR1-RELATED SEQUENCE 5 isoform X1 [Elaeis guineensis]XP_010914595.1 protein FAR1-RELATED SEQUENCE 5 isoform X1 [Elaeis guineensis]XP_010914596.1 protein FAR1-RELATED SEQUENCE 5 isoform X1 [Elaeis guineensis]XP_010914597.1 protein FAR1-RELATED SEQUENCE 5 isoform X1 [Elaeis guineensis]XP_010914598.1 protein FAR1-RELATED SEQUENCE 5 isoform X1 [Elaeis guineensis]XP_019703959.1 protein FAR1-RELATED SEQUENCE 5 isoform X1 [Elaeis guineensis]XP_019703960.1 protein FAR1-RELATED SEQUENCE 5 
MSRSEEGARKETAVPNVSPTSIITNTNEMDRSVKNTNAMNGSIESANSTGGSLVPGATDNSQIEPKVGMMFYSEDRAYSFYNSYAKRKGFSVRKDHLSRRRDGSIRYRHYVCSNEGSRPAHRVHMARKSRPIERTNCLARIEFKVNNDNVWVVNKFMDEHNHPLASPNNSHMLRSHRKKLPVQRAVLTKLDCHGVKAAQLHNFQAEATHCTEDAGFVLRNQCNHLNTDRMRELDKGDAQFLLEFLKAKQSENPSFFYAIQLDGKERLTNCFWADAQSVIDYAYFGDAVTFDTTYRASGYDIPFAPFIGINNHKQIVIFGAALLLDESEESFVWLLKTFLAAMSGKQPKTIFTDQCLAMSKAITMCLPNTRHQFCLWHILQNAPIHLPSVCNSEPHFHREFENCIYAGGLEDDFHKKWENLITKYGLESNSWLKDLYAVREQWALVYHGNSFSATMTTKQWAENMEGLFKIHFYRKLPFTKFIIQYLKALVQLRDEELLEDYESWHTKPVLFVEIPMLIEAAEAYTRVVYEDFEYEYKSQLACLCEPVGIDGTVYTFRVYMPQKQGYGLVEFNPSDVVVACSCKKFESMGILCMHALKVLNNNNILDLPSQYILRRWTKDAKVEAVSNRHQSAVASDNQASLTLRYNHVCRKAIAIAVKSAVSKDALDILEHGLDRFIAEMEKVLHNDSTGKQTDDVNVNSMPQNPLETNQILFQRF